MEPIVMLLELLKYLIIADVVLSWIQRDDREFPRSLTSKLTKPIYAPIHSILKPSATGNIDLAPLVIYFAISALQRAL